MECGQGRGWCTGALGGRDAVERPVNANGVVIISEFAQFPRQVERIPEEHVIEIFAPNRSNQPFDKGM